ENPGGSVTPAARIGPARNRTKQNEYQYDDEYGAERHILTPSEALTGGSTTRPATNGSACESPVRRRLPGPPLFGGPWIIDEGSFLFPGLGLFGEFLFRPPAAEKPPQEAAPLALRLLVAC